MLFIPGGLIRNCQKMISLPFLQSVMINVYRLTASSPLTLPSPSDLIGMMLRNCVEEISGQFIALTQISPLELILAINWKRC